MIRWFTIFVGFILLTACEKRTTPLMEAPKQNSPVIHIRSGGFKMSYESTDIADPSGMENALRKTNPESLDILYDIQPNLDDLDAALRYFSERGIGRYNLISASGRKFPFFLAGIADTGALDRAVNAPHKTYLLEEVLAMRSEDSVPRFSHIMFPAHPVRVKDLERCLEKCSSSGSVTIESDRIYLFTGQYEDWVRRGHD